VTFPGQGSIQQISQAEPRTLKVGFCFCALAQPQFYLRLVTLGGRWGCGGPARSMGRRNKVAIDLRVDRKASRKGQCPTKS
jgi:hypothetical protein